MGHYDDEIEAEREMWAREARKKQTKAYLEMDTALKDLGAAIGEHFQENKSMKSSLNQLQREFVYWQWENDILTENPDMIINVLKDA